MSRDRRRWLLLGAVGGDDRSAYRSVGLYVAYPLVLLTTYVRDHGVARGGSFESFVMAPDASGLATL